MVYRSSSNWLNSYEDEYCRNVSPIEAMPEKPNKAGIKNIDKYIKLVSLLWCEGALPSLHYKIY